ncbi:MAG: hypothetical protein WC838_04830, partial [Candidatus Margulisiibacteriota bacterium]
FRLHEKVKNGEIDANFSTQDIQRAVDETARLNIGSVPNRERLLKNLLTFFIERPADQRNRYCLTEYARKFVLLIDHKINNPFRKFPLRESFKRYADFSALEIRQINQFESWYNQGFQATTRENIFDHLEELKADVKASVLELNKLLYSGEQPVLTMAGEFSRIFTDLGDKADEIRDTLRLGNTLLLEIEQVVLRFFQQTQDKRPETSEEFAAFNELIYAYTRSQDIQQEVKIFFDTVDAKLGQLREQIQFASNKLNELRDVFRFKSRFKINLKRLLEQLISETSAGKADLVLPGWLPRPMLIEERFRLTAMPDFDRDYESRNMVLEMPEDSEHRRLEMGKVEAELGRQQRTAVLVAIYKERLMLEGALDFTTEFYRILEEEQDEEIAIQVAYELVQYTRDQHDLQLSILPEIQYIYYTQPITTWTINLQRLT